MILFTQAKNQLSPAEKALDDVSDLVDPMKPQLDELKDLVKNGKLKAQEAQEDADKAEDEAAAANEVRNLTMCDCTLTSRLKSFF